MTYGVIASVLINRGTPPLLAGTIVGLAAWLLVDEGLSLPTFRQYPPESHIRGLVGHTTYGLTAGALLSLTSRRRTAHRQVPGWLRSWAHEAGPRTPQAGTSTDDVAVVPRFLLDSDAGDDVVGCGEPVGEGF